MASWGLKSSLIKTSSVRRTPLACGRVPPASRAESRCTVPKSSRRQHRGPKSVVIVTAAATEQEAQAEASDEAVAPKEWVALVANAEFMLHDIQNEAFAEQLRERKRFFGESGREMDFWLVPEPAWLDKKLGAKAKTVRRPCVALVSTDLTWMTFMKLRLDRVLQCQLGTISKEEALEAAGKVPDFGEFKNWTGPYPPYADGWWEVFFPEQQAVE